MGRDYLWHVRTREGERGPFLTRRAAAVELCEFIGAMEFIDRHPECVPTGVDIRDVTIVHCCLPNIF